MRSIQFPFLHILFAVVMVASGCQGGPVIPSNDPGQESTGSPGASSRSSHHCLGYYGLVLDTETLSVDIVPARSGDLHLNVVSVLNTTMGVVVEGVPSEHDPPNGLFVFDITLTHPFETRPQLAGFDVKGILMTPGTLSIGPLVFADIDETRLENADGYTRWWNPTEFTAAGMLGYTEGVFANADASELTATINPYKYFADSLGATTSMQAVYNAAMDADDGRGVFAAGESNTRRYRIRFPMDPGPQVVFGYAVDASWDFPSPNPPDEIPDDFPIEANQPEAYYLLPQAKVNTLYYDAETGIRGGVLRLQINVHDWQGQNAGDIPAEVDVVRVFSPDLMSGGITASFLNETSIKARYTADLFGEAVPTEAGEVLVAVRAGSAGPETYDQGVAPGPTSRLSACNALTVDIVDPECSADEDNSPDDATLINIGDNASGVVCPTIDFADYYYFNIPLVNEATGNIRVYSDAGPTLIELFDSSHNTVAEDTTLSMCEFSLDDLSLLPGKYYIGIAAHPTSDVLPYFLELDAELVDVSPCGAVDVTPDSLHVEAYDVYMHENYAFLVDWYGVWVFDVTDPGNPVLMRHVETTGASRSDYRHPYCYGIAWGGSTVEWQLDMIDFSDPLNPVVHTDLVHYLEEAGPGFCMDEQYLYIEHDEPPDYEIQIWDYATNPTSPTLVTDIDTTSAPNVLAVTEIPSYGKYLIVGGEVEAWAYSIQDLGLITSVPPYAFPACTDVTVIECDEETLYIIHRTSAWDHFLYTLQLDASGPDFTHFDAIELPGNAYSMMLDEPYLYVGGSGTSVGLSVYDVSTPTAPVFDNSHGLIDYGRSLDKSGDTLCVVPGDAGLEFFDMADPGSPYHYAHLPVCNTPEDMVAVGDYLFVIDSAQADRVIHTVDISDPANAFVAASYTPPGTATCIDADGTNVVYTYFVGTRKWMLLDASDPLNLTEVTSQSYDDPACAIKLTADAVYVGTTFPEVLVFDYSVFPPANVGGVMLAESPQDMTIGLDHLYVTTYGGIEVLSLSDPLGPGYEGLYAPTDWADMCQVAGEYLYIAGGSTLEVASLVDPSNPVFEASLEVSTTYDVEFLAIAGQYAFLTAYESPIFVIQRLPIDDPSFECYVHEIDDYSCYKLIAHQEHLYEMNYYEGLTMYDLY